ncbi:MAG: hypothetical protein WCT46_03895 [Candidatus Gracilibacteria bacterium]|jgi:hypothetical protein
MGIEQKVANLDPTIELTAHALRHDIGNLFFFIHRDCTPPPVIQNADVVFHWYRVNFLGRHDWIGEALGSIFVQMF